MKTNILRATINNEAAAEMATTYQRGIDWKRACSYDDRPNGILKDRAEQMPTPSVEDKFKSADAVEELIELCQELISFIVDEYIARNDVVFDYEDLIYVGRRGFLNSLYDFKPKSDLLSDFVVPFINMALFAFIADSDTFDTEMPN